MIDDHSRYVVCLKACADERRLTVQDHLTAMACPTRSIRTMARRGATVLACTGPGSRFGCSSSASGCCMPGHVIRRRVARTSASIARSRTRCSPCGASAICRRCSGLSMSGAVGMDVPASRYRPSSRAMPNRLPKVEYDNGEIVRTVSSTRFYISFKGRMWIVPRAFAGERLAIRP